MLLHTEIGMVLLQEIAQNSEVHLPILVHLMDFRLPFLDLSRRKASLFNRVAFSFK